LAGQRGHNVDVIRGMPDRDPPHPEIITGGREPSTVHDPGRDLRPFVIREHAILRRGTHGAMPYRLRITGSGEGGQGLGEQPGQAAEVTRSVDPDRWLQVGRITEPGDQVRIGVLIRFPGPYR